MKMPIPWDWDGTGFCDYVVNWPDSPIWRKILKGLLTNPSLEQFWDATTGDVPAIITDFQPTLNTNLDDLECDIVKIPVGTVVGFAGSTIPQGWVLCNGGQYNSTDYPELYGVIGDIYGTPLSGWFNVPDLRSRVIVGRKSSQTEFDTLGETGGEISHTLTTSEMPAHNHSGLFSRAIYPSTGAANAMTTVSATPVNTANSGGGDPHNNLQPYITLNYIIRAV